MIPCDRCHYEIDPRLAFRAGKRAFCTIRCRRLWIEGVPA